MTYTEKSGWAPEPANHEQGTEGLRGFCALLVLYTHLLAPYTHLDPTYSPSALFWLFDASQGAVLLFFVLSGYVIGITNQRQLSAAGVVDYIRRRAVRLCPLYALAISLSIAIRPVDTWPTVVGNLLFLQNDLPIGTWYVPAISGNTNLWSLNYEVLYYLLFVLLWGFPRCWPVCFVASAAVGMFAWHIPTAGAVIATYGAGWVFWLAGYRLASAPAVGAKADPLPWPSLILLWLATWHLKPLWWAAHRFGLLPDVNTWIHVSYCDFIPASVTLLAAASGRRFPKLNILVWVSLLLPLGFSVWLWLRGRGLNEDVLPYEALVVLAMLLWRWRPSPAAFHRLAPIGAISYAIYIFQRPVQWLVLDRLPLPAGTWLSFALRLVVTVLLTLIVSYLAERVFQPRIRAFLLKPASLARKQGAVNLHHTPVLEPAGKNGRE